MVWPSWLWIGTPLKFSLWALNRIATWTGIAVLWKRLRRQRLFWLWLVLINTASLGVLGLMFFWLHARSAH